MNEEEFYQWECASRDTIDVKRVYIDICEDLVAGILLSQIIYWFLPSQQGSKLRVEKGGELWLAKSRTDWWEECRITPRQFDRAAAILQQLNLIDLRRFRFEGSPTVHIHLNIQQVITSVNSILTKRQNPTSPNVNFHFDETLKTISKVVTETTTETTTEIAAEDAVAVISDIPLTTEQTEILRLLWALKTKGKPSWKHEPREDAEWLIEFMSEFPGLRISHLRALRDYYSDKDRKANKGTWKNRLRNWLKNEHSFTKEDRNGRTGGPGHHHPGALATDEEREASIGAPLR